MNMTDLTEAAPGIILTPKSAGWCRDARREHGDDWPHKGNHVRINIQRHCGLGSGRTPGRVVLPHVWKQGEQGDCEDKGGAGARLGIV